jgi:elongation factor P
MFIDQIWRQINMFSASDLKKGLKVEVDGDPWAITEFEFCKPGKGTALYRCKLKNMITGSTMDRTYRPTDKLDKPNLEEKEVYYSYADGDFFVFSDENYEEMRVSKDVMGRNAYFLIENSLCNMLLFNGAPIEITLPTFIEKVIMETEPGARGDTATNVLKAAKIDNGYEIQVPLFINTGDLVKIDTRTGLYVERVNKA